VAVVQSGCPIKVEPTQIILYVCYDHLRLDDKRSKCTVREVCGIESLDPLLVVVVESNDDTIAILLLSSVVGDLHDIGYDSYALLAVLDLPASYVFPAIWIILREIEKGQWRGQMLRVNGHVLISLPNGGAQLLLEAGVKQERTL
jgi:hypothetical protein